MIRLPKVSDPADLMMRNSLFQPTPIRERFVGCPASQLFNPVIPPAIEKVENLMTYSREEMAELINRQQGDAEREIQEMRVREQEQLEAPASAMEEYYMQILSNIRQKEQAEIDNAYLTQQQKNDLQASALARKAGIDGNLVRKADEMVATDKMADELVEKAIDDAAEMEARSMATRDPSMMGAPTTDFEEDDRADDGGEMARMTAAAMASAGGRASASSAARAEPPAQAVRAIEEFGTFREGLLTALDEEVGKGALGKLNSGRVKRWMRDNQTALLRQFTERLNELLAMGVYTSSTYARKLSNMRTSLRTDPEGVFDIISQGEEAVRRKFRMR
jgi:hypothetical protein